MRIIVSAIVAISLSAGVASAQVGNNTGNVQPNANTAAPQPDGDPPRGSAADVSQRGRGTSDLNNNSATHSGVARPDAERERSGTTGPAASPPSGNPAGELRQSPAR